MEVTIKATLCEGQIIEMLYYDIQFKIGKSFFYHDCYSLSLLSSFERDNTRAFKEQCVEILENLTEEEVREMIINKVKTFLGDKIKEQDADNKYRELKNKFNSLKFKATIK